MRSLLNSLVASLLLATPLTADTLPNPSGEVILTVSGEIEHQNSDGVVQLDAEMLKALPQHVFSTSTIWIEGNVKFTGVRLLDLLDFVGSSGSKIEAVALNDYKIEIPVDSIEADAPIVAYLMNDEEMSARNKGPLWIVYPYDSDKKYRTEVIYSRSIWQLDRIRLVE